MKYLNHIHVTSCFGHVLYEMASLHRAFDAPNLPALVLKIMRGTVAPISAKHYRWGRGRACLRLAARVPWLPWRHPARRFRVVWRPLGCMDELQPPSESITK